MKKIAVILLAILAMAGILWAAEAQRPKPTTYTDGLYGFSVQGPAFPKAGNINFTPVQMSGPPDNGFAPNMNVLIQPGAMTRDDFRSATLADFKTLGLKVNSEKSMTVSGKSAILWDYEGTMQGKQLRFLALAVIDSSRILIVTCGMSKEGFPKYEKEFRACVNSFRLTP